jgi:hypothetical protein
LSYAEKIFALSKQWAKARDSRSAPRLAPRLFPALWFVMFAARLPSFNALVQLRRSASLNRWLATRKKHMPATQLISGAEGGMIGNARNI